MMGVIVVIAARLQTEIRLHHDQTAAGAEYAPGFGENTFGLFEGEVLEEIGGEDGGDA